jgi:hypothetical protein
VAPAEGVAGEAAAADGDGADEEARTSPMCVSRSELLAYES